MERWVLDWEAKSGKLRKIIGFENGKIVSCAGPTDVSWEHSTSRMLKEEI